MACVYITKDKDIGFFGIGKIPVRKDQYKGSFMKNGTTTDEDWIALTNSTQAPQIINPKKGKHFTLINFLIN